MREREGQPAEKDQGSQSEDAETRGTRVVRSRPTQLLRPRFTELIQRARTRRIQRRRRLPARLPPCAAIPAAARSLCPARARACTRTPTPTPSVHRPRRPQREKNRYENMAARPSKSMAAIHGRAAVVLTAVLRWSRRAARRRPREKKVECLSSHHNGQAWCVKGQGRGVGKNRRGKRVRQRP